MIWRAACLIATSLLVASCIKGPTSPAAGGADAKRAAEVRALEAAPGGRSGDTSMGGTPLFPEIAEFQPHDRLPNGSCVPDEIIRADQMVKLRTELMVAGLSCQRFYPEIDNPFNQYMIFTANHQQQIRDVQNTLGSFIGRQRSGSPARLYDEYATNLANDEAEVVNDVSMRSYCLARQQQFAETSTYSRQQLSDHLDEALEFYRERYNSCEGSSVATADD